jgi:hypothetical protein
MCSTLWSPMITIIFRMGKEGYVSKFRKNGVKIQGTIKITYNDISMFLLIRFPDLIHSHSLALRVRRYSQAP